MKKKILVVDDEPGMREIIFDDLVANGYVVLTAASGNQALSLLNKENVDLILSDVRMPDGDGIFLLKEVRKKYPTVPVVALMTGFSDLTNEEAEDYGAMEILSKPYDYENFLALIKRVLGDPTL